MGTNELNRCFGLMKYVPYRLMYLNKRSLLGDAVSEDYRTFRGKGLLEELHHWRWALTVYSLVNTPCFLFLLCVCVCVKYGLPASCVCLLYSCCQAFPCHDGLYVPWNPLSAGSCLCQVFCSSSRKVTVTTRLGDTKEVLWMR